MSFFFNLDLGLVGILAYALAFLFALTIIVFIHEYGHFQVARWCGVKVDTFSVGFGREIWGWTDRHGTRWKIGWLPLGGFVKFEGDSNVASMPEDNSPSRSPDTGDFHQKEVWQRAAVVAAGPIANFLLAIAIFALSALAIGVPINDPRIDGIVKGGVAEQAGLLPGDYVRSIDGRTVDSFYELAEIVRFRPGEKIVMGIERNGAPVSLELTVGLREETDPWAGTIRVGFLGVEHSDANDMRIERQSISQSIYYGLERTWMIVDLTLRYVKKLFLGQESPAQLGGVMSMAKAAGDAAAAGLLPFVWVVGFLSVSIGLINLFPIPMLDGGHLVFYAIEAVRRRPLDANAQEWCYRIGFSLVLALMLIGNGNDVWRFFKPILGL
jgi:regulator of sigma E protease